MEKRSLWLDEDLTMSFERHKGTVPPRPVVHLSGVPEIPDSQKECGIRAYSFLSLKNVSRHWGLAFYGNSRSLCKLKGQGN
jgi:hypothetical protein